MFWKSTEKSEKNTNDRHESFAYLGSEVYLDAACQTLRPQEVIDAQNEYYLTYNACGDRVKHKWGNEVDKKVREVREQVLKFVKASSSDYEVAFTLNTTYGMNTILQQLRPEEFERIVISEIEHNSVYVPALAWAKKHGKEFVVLARAESGELEYKENDVKKAVVMVNTASNIDGRELVNVKELALDVKKSGGVLILDAAQGLTHHPELLHGVKYDALVSSAHKVYGPSLGVMVVNKSLYDRMDFVYLGGSTVTDTTRNGYTLYADEKYHMLEPGLQNFAGIIGFGEALKWVQDFSHEGKGRMEYEGELAQMLFDGLQELPVSIVNASASPVVSFYHEKVDGHQIGGLLSSKNIMCRTGYFCCHAYLVHDRELPPLARVSLGLYNTKEDVEKFLTTMKFITDNL